MPFRKNKTIFKNKQVSPTTIYVGPGEIADSPYYRFYLDPSGEKNITSLPYSEKYQFQRLNNASTHPFYLENVTNYQQNPTIYNDTNGITGSQMIIFNYQDITSEKDCKKLNYICTSHSNMKGELKIDNTMVTVYVSKGNLTNSPYYDFYLDPQGNNNITVLPFADIYEFKRLDNTNGHPFYLKNINNYLHTPSGYGSSQGIKGLEYIRFTNVNIDGSQLNYICTSHANMEDSLKTVDNNLTIYVSKGDLQTPYYNFYLENNTETAISEIPYSPIYTFKRVDQAITHPFYLINIDNYLEKPDNYSDSEGIKQDQMISFGYNAIQGSNLNYICTSHSSMTGNLDINMIRCL